MKYKYKIEKVKVKHPTLGELNKEVISYFDEKGDEITRQHYVDEVVAPKDGPFRDEIDRGFVTLEEKK